MRVVSLAHNMPTGPPLHSYQILSKCVKGYQSYGVHKDASSNGQKMDGWMDALLITIFPKPIGRGIKSICLDTTVFYRFDRFIWAITVYIHFAREHEEYFILYYCSWKD